MSRDKRDKRGGHSGKANCEVWSRRYYKVNMWPRKGRLHKDLTVRYERRTQRQAMTRVRREQDEE